MQGHCKWIGSVLCCGSTAAQVWNGRQRPICCSLLDIALSSSTTPHAGVRPAVIDNSVPWQRAIPSFEHL